MASLSKSFAVKFLFRIGGSATDASLFRALPGFIAILATIPGILWMSKTSNKKRTMGKFFLSSRIFILFFALVPFLPSQYQPILFIILTSLMNFPEVASSTALQSFSGDIFPPEERSNAIALRNKFSTLAQLLSLIILGKLLSGHGKSDSQIIHMYQLFFVIAFIIGLIEIKSFYGMKETSCETQKSEIDFKKSLTHAFHNKKFLSFMSCSLLFHFGWQMGWPLFDIYQIQYLKAAEGWLTILNITSSLVMFMSFNFWNRMIHKKGNSLVMAVSTMGMAITPVLFALSPNLYIMTITGLVTGFFTAGTITVILSSLLEVIPEKERLVYVGIHATLTNITLAIAPMVGNVVLSHSSIYMALVVTALFRALGSAAFFIRNKKIKHVVRMIN
jgi:MFS family permease